MSQQLTLLEVARNGRVRSPFRYPGGKFYAVKYLERVWEKVPHDEYREPFVGGGQVFFAKPKVEFNWLNDIFAELMNVYRTIQDDELRPKLTRLLSGEHVDKARHALMKEWTPRNPLESAHRFYFLNRTSYSGIMHKPAWGYHPLNSAPPKSWVEFIDKAAEKLQGVRLTALDFEDVMRAPAVGKQVFMYLDPPYIEADQERAYAHSFTMKDHERLVRLLRQTKYKFLLTYDDCNTARRLYSWANLRPEEWWYNTANIRTKTRKKGRELLITNF